MFHLQQASRYLFLENILAELAPWISVCCKIFRIFLCTVFYRSKLIPVGHHLYVPIINVKYPLTREWDLGNENIVIIKKKISFHKLHIYLLYAFHLLNKCKYCLHCMYMKTAPPVNPTATTTNFVQKGQAEVKKI